MSGVHSIHMVLTLQHVTHLNIPLATLADIPTEVVSTENGGKCAQIEDSKNLTTPPTTRRTRSICEFVAVDDVTNRLDFSTVQNPS